jgi:NACalpha-BTF3-like transcription factor
MLHPLGTVTVTAGVQSPLSLASVGNAAAMSKNENSYLYIFGICEIVLTGYVVIIIDLCNFSVPTPGMPSNNSRDASMMQLLQRFSQQGQVTQQVLDAAMELLMPQKCLPASSVPAGGTMHVHQETRSLEDLALAAKEACDLAQKEKNDAEKEFEQADIDLVSAQTRFDTLAGMVEDLAKKQTEANDSAQDLMQRVDAEKTKILLAEYAIARAKETAANLALKKQDATNAEKEKSSAEREMDKINQELAVGMAHMEDLKKQLDTIAVDLAHAKDMTDTDFSSFKEAHNALNEALKQQQSATNDQQEQANAAVEDATTKKNSEEAK